MTGVTGAAALVIRLIVTGAGVGRAIDDWALVDTGVVAVRVGVDSLLNTDRCSLAELVLALRTVAVGCAGLGFAEACFFGVRALITASAATAQITHTMICFGRDSARNRGT